MGTTATSIEDGFTKVTVREDDTYGLVLSSIENLVDGTSVTFNENSMPFRISFRDFAEDGSETLTEPSAPTTYSAPETDTYALANRYGANDGMLGRTVIRWEGTFENAGTSTTDVSFVWEAQLIDGQPGRVFFVLYHHWDTTQTGTVNSIVFKQPFRASFDVVPSDQYLLAMNNGMVNRSPRTELVGNGSDYQFRWESKFNPEQYDPDTGNDDTFEAYYPGPMSMPLTGYGSRTSGWTMYQHDNLEFRGTRVKDTCNSTTFTFRHEVTPDGVCEEFNGDTTTYDGPPLNASQRQEMVGTGRFVRLFKAKTENIGEEVGLDYRKYALSSTPGVTLFPQKPYDDTTRATVSTAPLWLIMQAGDYDAESGVTTQIISEIRQALPDLASTKIPVHFAHIHQPYSRTSDTSKSDPAGFRELPDLFNIYIDDDKHNHITNRQAADNIYACGEIELFRPTEWDHRNLFAGSGTAQRDWGGDNDGDTNPGGSPNRFRRSGARVCSRMGMYQQYNETKFNTTHGFNTGHCIVDAMSYTLATNETTITVDPGVSPAFDPGAWDVNVTYSGRVYCGQGVVESGPRAGNTVLVFQKGNTSANSEVDWKTTRTFYCPGDVTADVNVGDNLLLLYCMGVTEPIKDGVLEEQYNFLPGEQSTGSPVIQVYDGAVDTDDEKGIVKLPHQTQMCCLADSFGIDDYPANTYGPTPQLLADLDAEYYNNPLGAANNGTGFQALVIRNFGKRNMTCFDWDHSYYTGSDWGGPIIFQHRSATPDLITKIRELVQEIKDNANATTGQSEFAVLADYGPADWQVGSFDGYVRAGWRNDLTTSAGSWGQTGLFPTAFGGLYTAGFYRGDLATGNVATGFGALNIIETGREKFAEALVQEWCLNLRTPSISMVPSTAGRNGSSALPGGGNSWTPFFDGAHGMYREGSVAELLAQMVQVNVQWQLPQQGRRVRSLRRLNLKGVTRATPNLTIEGYDFSPYDEGDPRPPMSCPCFIRDGEPRKIYAIVVNEADRARGDSFEFVPDYYQDVIAGGLGGYQITRHVVEKDGITSTSLGWHHGPYQTREYEETSQITVYEFDFTSGLRFFYAYDDDADTEIPIPNEGARHRVGEIHGHGERMQIGFKSDLPDEEVEISQVALRVRGLGRSENP